MMIFGFFMSRRVVTVAPLAPARQVAKALNMPHKQLLRRSGWVKGKKVYTLHVDGCVLSLLQLAAGICEGLLE